MVDLRVEFQFLVVAGGELSRQFQKPLVVHLVPVLHVRTLYRVMDAHWRVLEIWLVYTPADLA